MLKSNECHAEGEPDNVKDNQSAIAIVSLATPFLKS
jgi:hypothetical protein